MRDPGRLLAFDDYELDFGRGELRRGGKFVEIQPTPLRVLLHLAEHRDRTVSRRELLDAVWPDVVVGDEALTTALKEARHAVGDAGVAQRVIRTQKGIGYRFVAEVIAPANVATADFASGLEEAAPSGRPAPRRHSNRLAFAVGVLAVVALSLAAWSIWSRAMHPPLAPDPRPPHMLAILPFSVLTRDPALETFASALKAQIVDALQPPVHLLPSLEPRPARGDSTDQQLARVLGATHVLQGTVVRERDRLRVTVELHAISSARVVWSESYDRPGDDLLAAQDVITNQVAEEVPTRLPWRRSDDPARAALIEDVEQGRAQIWSGDFEGALATLQGVVDRDPDNAAAHAVLTEVWINLGNHGRRDPDAASARVKWHAAEAQRSAPGSVDAHAAAAISLLAEHDWLAGEREARAACERDASPMAFGCLTLRAILLSMGRAEESAEVSRGQVNFFPYLAYPRFHLGLDLLILRRYRDAELAFTRAAELTPRGGSFGTNAGPAMAGIARYLDGRPDSIDILAQRLGDELVAAEVKRIFRSGGMRAVRLWGAQHATGPMAEPFDQAIKAAVFYAEADDVEDSLSALERTPRHSDFPQYLLLPIFDNLRDEPRYKAIIEKLGLTAYHARYLKRGRGWAPPAT